MTQIVSYEISINLILNIVSICVGSYNFHESVRAQKKLWVGTPKKKSKHMPSSCVNKHK